ncbi:MAG TPA: prolipoprotein diacylglyceryl transferase [Crocinitomix sp.]|nr:prolipoprotein diacylglyceryl transferase [Crocinitomix sp.]
MWLLGYLIGLKILERMFKHEKVPMEWADKTFMYVLIGGILGARIGHCLFYDWGYYSQNPIEILYIWQGGLASHGGAIGIIIAAYILSKKVTKKSILWIVDRIAVPTSFAGGLIRLGNLFNSEIVGKETTSSIGFKFIRHDIPVNWAVEQTGKSSVNDAYDAIVNNPAFADVLVSVPVRYPTQLIEAVAYFIIFILMMLLYWKTNAKNLLGFLVGTFFVTIFGARFFIEYLKIEQGGTDSNLGMFNMGQYLSIPLVLIGLYLILRHIKSLKVNKNA